MSWERCWREYRRQAFGGVLMTIVASMVVERTARGDEMFLTWLARAAQQVLDLDVLDLLPAPAAGKPAGLQPDAGDEGRHRPVATEWMWNALHVDDGTHNHAVAVLDLPGFGVGYVQKDGRVEELESLRESHDVAANGLITGVQTLSDPPSITATDRAGRLRRDPAASSRRARRAVSPRDVPCPRRGGRTGTRWIEWNARQRQPMLAEPRQQPGRPGRSNRLAAPKLVGPPTNRPTRPFRKETESAPSAG